jgi:type I restriction enzyme, S subunit
MEMKVGYKETEIGTIPEDWEVKSLGRFIALQRGHDLTERQRRQGDVPVMGSAGANGFHDTARAKGPGVALGRSGASFGQAHYCESDFWPHNTALYVTDFFGSLPLFVFYFLKSIDFSRHNSGGAQQSLNRNFIAPIQVAVPRRPEQELITNALSDADALIVSLDGLIAKKRDLKQAAMQQLLTGNTRLPGFTGKWESVTLGERGSFSKGRGVRRNQVRSEGLPCVRYGEIYTHHQDIVREHNSFISREVALESQRLKQGDLLFAGSGETAEEIGKCVAFIGSEEAYAGGDIVIFSPRTDNSVFLGYLMNHSSILLPKARMGQGDAVVHISARNLATISFDIPEPDEQSAIAAILLDMDADLAALEVKRDKTRALKLGMMQELMTGKIRLI